MEYYIGIDLGTSAVKLILADNKGNVVNTVSKGYKLYIDGVNSEQNPEDWWTAVKDGIAELTKNFDKKKVVAIGTGGQMHGLVMLDSDGKVIRPAILWNDGRAVKETDRLNKSPGKKALLARTGNIAFAGFTAPKILWVKSHEPENFARLSMILLPKDYITFKLTGEYATDVSDASGTLLFDCENRFYSPEMVRTCGIDISQLPQVYESYEVVSTIDKYASAEIGLPTSVRVVAGAGDNAAAAVGMGVVNDGDCNISLGTSGTLFVAKDEFICDGSGAIHSFCHANGGYHIMGCMLSAASCNNWFCNDILGIDDYAALQKGIKSPGENKLYFLPYLMGERCPHNDPNASGAFIGLKMSTTKEDMLLAIMEGVAFGVKDSMELAAKSGVEIDRSSICGGGAKSPLWQQITADVLDIELDVPTREEGPAYGGAVLAMVGNGFLGKVSDCKSFAKVKKTISPDTKLASIYKEKYLTYKSLYPALKDFYKKG